MENAQIGKKALLHLRMRWMGLPFFFSGVVLFCLALTSFPMSRDFFSMLLGFGSMAGGLTVFGVNHDTAIAYAILNHPDTKDLPTPLVQELEEDLAWNQASTLSLSATPKTAFFIPFFVLLVQLWLSSRLSCHFKLGWIGTLCESPWFGG